MKNLVFFSVAFAALCGCSENDSLVGTNFSFEYSIEQSRSCFCPNSGEKVKLFVNADSIVDVILLSDHSHPSRDTWDVIEQ